MTVYPLCFVSVKSTVIYTLCAQQPPLIPQVDVTHDASSC